MINVEFMIECILVCVSSGLTGFIIGYAITKLLMQAPIGEEIEGVGFINKDKDEIKS
jgi:ABC-type antimicrobial peptide transport system permease subunit